MKDNNIDVNIFTSEPETFSSPAVKMTNAANKLSRLFAAFSIAYHGKKDGYRSVVLNDLSSLWLAPVFKLFGFKVISLLHLYLQKKSENPLGHSKTEYSILKLSAKFCDKIFSVNKNNCEVFAGMDVDFIGNFVPTWFYIDDNYFPEKKYDFIMVSRLSRMKNIPLFLDLLSGLIEHSKVQYKALIVGEGPERCFILEYIKKKGLASNVKVMDWVDRKKLPEVYDMGKCFVISSFHEGFATTLLEAHARGVPAIVTKSAGFCGEFVQGFNENTGLVFEPEAIHEDLFLEMVKGLIDKHSDMRQCCKVKAAVFSEENVLSPIAEACILSVKRD